MSSNPNRFGLVDYRGFELMDAFSVYQRCRINSRFQNKNWHVLQINDVCFISKNIFKFYRLSAFMKSFIPDSIKLPDRVFRIDSKISSYLFPYILHKVIP